MCIQVDTCCLFPKVFAVQCCHSPGPQEALSEAKHSQGLKAEDEASNLHVVCDHVLTGQLPRDAGKGGVLGG